jgi:hypothetical protein
MSFKTEDEANKNSNEDNFGLPDLDYKPLDELKSDEPVNIPMASREQASLEEETDPMKEPIREERNTYIPMEPQPASKAPMVIITLIGLALLVGGFFFWKYVIEPRNEKARIEALAKEKARKEAEEQRLLAEQQAKEEAKRLADEAAAKATPPIGEIQVLSSTTGRYYIVISSAVDADLLMDYAKKLSAKGVGSKIIPPFGKWKFSRLAIADHDTFASAQSAADGMKAEYGDAVWVIRY